MAGFQTQVYSAPSPASEEEQDGCQPNSRYNLENAFIYIDGKRYSVKELLKLVVEAFQEKGDTGNPA